MTLFWHFISIFLWGLFTDLHWPYPLPSRTEPPSYPIKILFVLGAPEEQMEEIEDDNEVQCIISNSQNSQSLYISCLL